MDRATSTEIQLRVQPPERVIPVAEVLQAGIELKQQAKSKTNHDGTKGKPMKRVKPIYDQTELVRCPQCKVNKIQYPADKEFKGCHHGRTKFQLRLGINRQQQQKNLAAPSPIRLEKPLRPIWIQRPILCPTFRLAQLALPKKSHVANTWKNYAAVLDAYHIENCQKNMKDLRITEARDAVEYFTQKQNSVRSQRRKRHLEIRKIQQKIKKMDQEAMGGSVQAALDGIYFRNLNFLLANNAHLMTPERIQISNYLLLKICSRLQYELPVRNSKAFFDMLIVNVCDNIAIYLSSMRALSGYNVFGDWQERTLTRPQPKRAPVLESCPTEDSEELELPIDDFIDYSTDDVSSTDCDSHVLSECDVEAEGEGEYEDFEDDAGDEELSKLSSTHLIKKQSD